MTFIAIFVTTERAKFWVEKSEINEWEQRLAILCSRYINGLQKNTALLINGSLYITGCRE